MLLLFYLATDKCHMVNDYWSLPFYIPQKYRLTEVSNKDPYLELWNN